MFSKDGKNLAALSADKSIRLWDAVTGKLKATYSDETGDGDVAICFSPDGKFLASGSWDKSIKIWDISKGTISRRLIGHQQAIRSIKYSPDGKFIASAGWDNEIKIWYESTGVNLKNFKGHKQCVRAIDFSPTGKYIASGGYDLHLKLWDVSSGEEIFSVKGHKFPIEAVAYHPSGKWIATGGLDNEIKIWDASNGLLEKNFSGHKEGIYTLAFSPDGTYLASAGNDQIILIWNVSTGQKVKEFPGHKQGVRSLSFSGNGRYLASGGIDNAVKIWNVESLNIRPVNAVSFQSENIDAVTTEWIYPEEGKVKMVFNSEQTLSLTCDEPGLNKFHLYHNKVEVKHLSDKDTVPVTPKSIKKFSEKIEISYDVKLKTGENEFQFFGENSENNLFTVSDAVKLNYFDIKEQTQNSRLYILVIAPSGYSDKKWSYNSDNADKFAGIIKTQEGKCFKEVIVTYLENPSETSKELIQSEILNIVNNCRKEDVVLLTLSGLFLQDDVEKLFYVSPKASTKEVVNQIIELESICKSLMKMSGFTGIIVDASRKPANIPEGYSRLDGKDIFHHLQTCLSYKKNYMILTTDNSQPLKLYDQLANAFHLKNDTDGNKAIDLKEMSDFIRNFTLSQFFYRGNIFPIFSHL
jgi:WD40 repeat protein